MTDQPDSSSTSSGAGGRRRGAKPGSTWAEASDDRRCQRIIALNTGGKYDLWRCGRRVRERHGFCRTHRHIADAVLLTRTQTAAERPGSEQP